MRAVFITEFGGPEKIQAGQIPEPAPEFGQALIRVKAAALNHLDISVRKGRPGLTLKGAHVMGSDAAGIIESLGPGCEQLALKPGDEVVLNPGVGCMACEACLRGQQSECARFRLTGFQNQGVYAEFAVVPAVNLFPKPAQLTWEEAAALPLAHVTAWHMLFERAKLLPCDTVLIHGIGGGVACAGLQLCQLCGATAIVTSSSDAKLARAKAMGAQAGINYRSTPDVAAAVKAITGGRGVDLVMDSVGAPTLPISMAAMRRGGRTVTCGITGGADAQLNMQQLYWNHLSLIGSTMGSMEDMRRLVRAAAEKPIRPVIDKVFPLEQYADAVKRMEAAEQFGKIVLNVSCP
ncbi:MAG TPA: zinc-binding dehydrogenase [Planctomycetota bacterium]|jgi:NADPH:quinone reductase-like Zn-dependent oxidoreductase